MIVFSQLFVILRTWMLPLFRRRSWFLEQRKYSKGADVTTYFSLQICVFVILLSRLNIMYGTRLYNFLKRGARKKKAKSH